MRTTRTRCVTLAWAILAAAAIFFAGCQTEDPPPAETFLRVRLNDSLASFEKVVVQIVDRNDPSKVLYTLWNGPLKAPASDIPGYNLKTLGTESFIVKVTGYKFQGQLALQTLIFYEPGHKTVLHDSVPKLKPLNWLESLKPSVGTIAPDFNRDSLRYTVTMPQGVNSLTFTAATASPEALLRVDGSPNASGSATKIFQVGSTPDSVHFSVTDPAIDSTAERNYTVVLIPTPPPGLYLSSLVPSYKSFTSPFVPEQTLYVFYMDADKDTLSFKATPVDPRTMTVTVDGQAVFSGQKSQTITVAPGTTKTIGIEGHRGSDLGYYQITLDHTQTNPP